MCWSWAQGSKHVLVLQARDRVGGRTLSVPFAGGRAIDLGAQWIGPKQRRVVALCREPPAHESRTVCGRSFGVKDRRTEPACARARTAGSGAAKAAHAERDCSHGMERTSRAETRSMAGRSRRGVGCDERRGLPAAACWQRARPRHCSEPYSRGCYSGIFRRVFCLAAVPRCVSPRKHSLGRDRDRSRTRRLHGGRAGVRRARRA